MQFKKLGATICSIALLSIGITGTQAAKPTLKQVEAQANSEEGITLSGRAEPYEEVLVSPSIEGKIKNVFTDLGSYVEQGQKLAELDEGDLAAEVKQAEDQIKIVEAQGNLTALEQQIALNQTMASLNQTTTVSHNTTTPTPESPKLPAAAPAAPASSSGQPELEAAKNAVKDAELTLNAVTEEWTKTSELFEAGDVSQEEIDQAAIAKDQAEIELESAKKKVEVETVRAETVKASIQQKYEEEKKKYEQEKAKYGQEKAKYEQDRAKYEREKTKYTQEANQAAQKKNNTAQDTMKLQKESSSVTSQMTQISVENAKAELEAIRARYNNLQIVAPVNGFITEKKGRIGEVVSSGLPLFVITNLDKLYISIDVPESMINRWKEDQSVKVEIPTQKIKVDGKVVYVGLMSNENKQTYPVKVLIDNADHKIKGGMKAVVNWKVEKEDKKPQ
ncbi:HlyD family secretion protein [Peribacillus loiseleuriae]|uniref:RND efflux pump membrane fusion protein barrel-sandwich domain-containing protein n=1 Tax=Peribacillus loiseleuriae TaxID=1679170 RepID=A0A0K9GZ46_9BACI|nr:efflux RND transporter periplasmic adaptor subunit [Peribacillus loiseleuriae]KMY51896.1 hypothetical protein AC625_22155 [Peribacillus loiseleuriae]